ncbi:site-specific integrase [Paenibacillus chondroitinus]|uniref:Site-specific integrase n=1 Tax=Paenibacillus chondroitinus TaxID=59842 RepID=A0ABU6D9T7_9BACL|nr:MULTISPECIES: site-specific integrase [Paenibacillus]MCY9661966.1 site-specific integrase [Paenibacillus anseongense]MEB4793652.1 site-specific integrase [Paenibacillus chondroitinus]
MSLQWLKWEDFSKLYLDAFLNLTKSSKRSYINQNLKSLKLIIEQLHGDFENGEKWFRASLQEKRAYREKHFTEMHYIIPWYLSIYQEYKDEIDHDMMLNYFQSDSTSSQIHYIWSQYFNLITDQEDQLISGDVTLMRSGFRKCLGIHTVLIMKPLQSFTDDDSRFATTISYPNVNRYNPKVLQDLRIKLGYSTVVISQKKQTNWDKLFNHVNPVWADLVSNYYNYLLVADAGDNYLTRMSNIFSELFNYLNEENKNDCTSFNISDFRELTTRFKQGRKKEISKTYQISKVTHLRKFFEWGAGAFPMFFPTYLNFPDEEWASLSKKASKEYLNSEGFAPSSDEIAKKMVDGIYNYVPENESEELCRWFWMIVVSSPPRFSFVMNLESKQALKPLPNQPEAFGLYSQDEDKAGNKYGQFPILDPLGYEAITELQKRADILQLKPIWNKKYNREFIHLFQFNQSPWMLSDSAVRRFFDKVKFEVLNESELSERISAHGYRTFLLTHIAMKTGSLEAVRVAAGHIREEMTRLYLKSRVSRNALLHRVLSKYEQGEVSGKFYVRLLQFLTSEDPPIEDMMNAFATEMALDEFLLKYGKRVEMGFCLSQESCDNWYKCWGCQHFLMRREEIQDAIVVLVKQIINMRAMIKHSTNYTANNSISAGQMRTISLIIKRLTELGLTEEKIDEMVLETLNKYKTKEAK